MEITERVHVERVNRAFRVGDDGDRVVIFAWSADPAPQKRNVARIDKLGKVVWRANLPGKAKRDAFIRLQPDGDGFIARTYSEWSIRLTCEGQAELIGRTHT